jgi:dTDP-4-dehydrorhamnose reductase
LRILVAGAAGQLGRALRPALRGHEAMFLDHAGLDIADAGAVRAAVAEARPAVVINAAAYNEVDRAEAEPEAALRGNATGPGNLAEAAAAAGAAILHVSSDYVFDGEAEAPYLEDAAPNPLSAYGRSKLAGERAVFAANPRHYIARTAWLYHVEGRNFPNTVRRLAEKGPVRVVNDQTGSPTFAPHLAEAIARLVLTPAYGIHHLAGAGATTWYELTRALFARLGIRAEVLPVTSAEFPRPARRPRYSVLASRGPIRLPAWQQGLEDYARALLSGRAA